MRSKNNKKTILITGASGFIGNALYSKLKNENYNIIGFDNFFRGKNLKNQTIIKGSIFDKKILKKLIRKSDIIIHLVAINGTRNFYNIPDKVFEVSMRGAMILYDCLNEIGDKNKKILLASSGEVYGEPKKIPTDERVSLVVKDIFNNRYSYGGGKICQDLIARYLISKVVKECIIFRPHNVYGPNMGFDHVIPELMMKSLKAKNKITIEGSGKETRSFCYIDDFLNGLIILIKKRINGFNIFNIGNDYEISINNLTKLIIKNSKKNLLVQNKKLRTGSSKRRCPDIKKIKKLGYKPIVSLETGIEKMKIYDYTLSKL
jgi:nucleoside-diphosphate-sugar epimerase